MFTYIDTNWYFVSSRPSALYFSNRTVFEQSLCMSISFRIYFDKNNDRDNIDTQSFLQFNVLYITQYRDYRHNAEVSNLFSGGPRFGGLD